MAKIDPNKVGWIPPEQLDKASGEYRVLEDVAEDNTPKWGARVVHVQGEDDNSRYEEYDQSKHGRQYRPQIREEDLDASS